MKKKIQFLGQEKNDEANKNVERLIIQFSCNILMFAVFAFVTRVTI